MSKPGVAGKKLPHSALKCTQLLVIHVYRIACSRFTPNRSSYLSPTFVLLSRVQRASPEIRRSTGHVCDLNEADRLYELTHLCQKFQRYCCPHCTRVRRIRHCWSCCVCCCCLLALQYREQIAEFLFTNVTVCVLTSQMDYNSAAHTLIDVGTWKWNGAEMSTAKSCLTAKFAVCLAILEKGFMFQRKKNAVL